MRKPVFVIGIIVFAFLVIAEAMMRPPEEKWYSRQYEAARSYEGGKLKGEPVTAERYSPEMEEIRKSARAQWDLAEWHFARGEYERAAKEYQRLIDEYPYIDLDWGYRSDDARNRLREIREIQAEQGP